MYLLCTEKQIIGRDKVEAYKGISLGKLISKKYKLQRKKS